jgi:hypothetical protein
MSSKKMDVVTGMARRRREFARRMEEASAEASEFIESGTFPTAQRRPMPTLPSEVTLVVYGWENVQPGTLAWVFPSLKAAITAARAMRNAVRWIIVAGQEVVDIATARSSGFVLAESV